MSVPAYFLLMKKYFLTITIFCLALAISPLAASAAEKNPKTANYFLHWSLNDSKARELAKWDFLILDMEVQENSPEQLRLIRQLNPDVVILAYVTSQNLFESWVNANESVLRKELTAGISDSWWLRDSSGQRLSDWPNAYVLNVTNYAPLVDGQRYNDYLPEFVVSNLKDSGYWNGVFFDNVWDGCSWFNGGNVSLRNNGYKSSAYELNTAWVTGMRKIFTETKQAWPEAIILGNGSWHTQYQNLLDGWMIEDFPTPWVSGGDWTAVMKNYQNFSNNGQEYNIVNAAANTSNNYQKFRYGLANALMGNGYYSFDYGPADHGRLWWYDEYEVDLGASQKAPYNLLDQQNKTLKPGLWRRDFTAGVAILNSTDKTQRFVFTKEEFERLRGNQDPAVNNGQRVNWISLAPNDGVILLKRPNVIKGSNFINGNFYRVFDTAGTQIVNGFFAYLDNYSGRRKLLKVDFAGTGVDQTAVAENGEMKISAQGRETLKFRPFGSWNGEFTMSFGDLNGDGYKEIIAGAGNGGGPQLRIFNNSGQVKGAFMAYDSRFRGGVNVAVGDLDGDGKAEIVTGAGNGGGPHVRVFDSQSRVKAQFMAYDKDFRGGVNVAVGDIDSDGKAEIITGPGLGGGPQVRVFDGQGNLKAQFMAYDRNLTTGLSVAVDDLNQDGRLDILASLLD